MRNSFSCNCLLLIEKKNVSKLDEIKTHKFISCIKLDQFFHYRQVCSARQKHDADRYILCRKACVSYCHKIIILLTLFLCCMTFLYLVKSLSLPPPPPPSFPIPSLCNSCSFLFIFSFYFPAASSCAFSFTVLSSPSLCSYVFISQYLFLSSMSACKTAFHPTLAKALGSEGLLLSTSSVII